MSARTIAPLAALRVAERVLEGAAGFITVGACALAAQRIALPLAALAFASGQLASAGLALCGAVLLGLGRAFAGDKLGAQVRANVLAAFLGDAEQRPPHLGDTADVVSPRFAICMPELVVWAQDGVVGSLAGLLATPLVLALLLGQFGVAMVAPVAVAALAVMCGAALWSRRVAYLWQRAWERRARVHFRFHELHHGLVELRAQGELARFADRVRHELAAFSADDARARRAQAFVSSGVSMAALVAALAAAVALGGPEAGSGLAELSRAALVGLAAMPTLLSLASGISKLTAARSELKIVAALPAARGPESVGEPIDAQAELRLEGIRFAYPATPASPARRVFEGFTWSLAPARSVAIVGPNGAGKTTLIHLILGVLTPDSGLARLGGRVVDLDHPSWHGSIAYVSQRPLEMYGETVAENVRVFAPAASDVEVVSALRAVGVWPLLRARAESDAAALSLDFGALSRGEARRVTLARAFARPANIVILDEPEANLDAGARAELLDALRGLSGRCRVVAAVHDPEMALFADEVLDLGAHEGGCAAVGL